MRLCSRPVVAGAVFVLTVTGWCLSRPFEWALEGSEARLFQYATIGAAGLLFWFPLISPSRVFPPARYGARLLYLSAIEVSLTGAFSYVLMAEHAMCPTYAFAPRFIPGLSALDDQFLGGILLSGLSSAVLVGVLGFTFWRWAAHSDDAGAATR